MSTNSRIGILIPEDRAEGDREDLSNEPHIRSIYCHWDGYPSHMGLTLHQNYGTIDLVNELLDKGDASLIDINGESKHYMHSEGGHPSDTMTVNRFTEHFLEQYNYIAVPVPNEDGFYTNVEWVVCEPPIKPRLGMDFKLVVNELLNPDKFDYPRLSTKEKQILYMDLHRIERVIGRNAVLGNMYKACTTSMNNEPAKLRYV